ALVAISAIPVRVAAVEADARSEALGQALRVVGTAGVAGGVTPGGNARPTRVVGLVFRRAERSGGTLRIASASSAERSGRVVTAAFPEEAGLGVARQPLAAVRVVVTAGEANGGQAPAAGAAQPLGAGRSG